MKRKYLIIFIIILVIYAVVVIALYNLTKWNVDKSIQDYKASQPKWERHLSYEEEDQMQIDIESHLTKYDVFDPEYMSVGVYSGGTMTEQGEITKEEKTQICIFLDGRLADSEEDAFAWWDGYHNALLLYFGEPNMDDYDIELYIAGKYKISNGVLVDKDN